MPNEATVVRPLSGLAAFEKHRHLFHDMAALPSHAWDAFYLATSWRTNGKIPEEIIKKLEQLGASIEGVNARKIQIPNASTTPLKRSSCAEILKRGTLSSTIQQATTTTTRTTAQEFRPAKDTAPHASTKLQSTPATTRKLLPAPTNARTSAIRDAMTDQ
jgi:hypothetical protein